MIYCGPYTLDEADPTGPVYRGPTPDAECLGLTPAAHPMGGARDPFPYQ